MRYIIILGELNNVYGKKDNKIYKNILKNLEFSKNKK
jgi:hypothetical protein